MFTRRLFLASSAGSLAAAVFPTVAVALASRVAGKPDTGHGLEARCEVYQGDQRIGQMNLVAVEQPFIEESRLVQYIFNFESAHSVLLPEATYRVSHPVLGTLELFLQPCGSFTADQHDGFQYRACISMLR